MILPYGSTNDINGRNDIDESNGKITAVYHNKNNPMGADNISITQEKLCVTKVVLTEGITLYVNGKMLISGQLDGGGAGNNYTGGTSGYYALLEVETNAQIIVNGILHVPGFITESDNYTKINADDPSAITVSRNGTIYQPFVVRDFKGGTATGSIYNSINDGVPYSPFNEFCTMNVYVELDIYGSVVAYANIYAGDQFNATVAPLIGITNASFIQLTSNSSHVIAKFDRTTEILKMDLYGGATTNSFKVTVNVLGEKTMTSQQFVFPISWMYDITLHSGNYNMTNGNRFKLLPGAKFTVESDASLKITYLNIYESFPDVDEVKSYKSTYQNVAAIFTVNGSVVAEQLAGKVYTTANGATVTVTKSAEISTQESQTYPEKEAVMLGGKVSTSISITSTLQLYYKYGESYSDSNIYSGAISRGVQYESYEDTSTKNWRASEYIAITIQPNWNVTIQGALQIDPETGKPLKENGSYVTYNPTTANPYDTFFFIPDSGATITFTLGSDEYLMKDGTLTLTGTNPANIDQSITGGTVTWPVTVTETVSVVRLPDIKFEGNTSQIKNSSITYYDRGDGTCTVNVYLGGTPASVGSFKIPFIGLEVGRVNDQAKTFSVTIDDGEPESCVAVSEATLNAGISIGGKNYEEKYITQYCWQNSSEITSDTTITIS